MTNIKKENIKLKQDLKNELFLCRNGRSEAHSNLIRAEKDFEEAVQRMLLIVKELEGRHMSNNTITTLVKMTYYYKSGNICFNRQGLHWLDTMNAEIAKIVHHKDYKEPWEYSKEKMNDKSQ